MTNSQIFKQAHALAKATIKAGDNYQATFALCLKAVYAQSKSPIATIKSIILSAIESAKAQDSKAEDFAMVVECVKSYGKAFRGLKSREQGIALFDQVLFNLNAMTDIEWTNTLKGHNYTKSSNKEIAFSVLANLISKL